MGKEKGENMKVIIYENLKDKLNSAMYNRL
jgi:hypothetical protein